MEISEVLTQMIKRACLYSTTTPATTSTSTSTVTSATTAFRRKMKTSSSKTGEVEKADGLDEVVIEPVVLSATASYPNLVSIHLLMIKLKCL